MWLRGFWISKSTLARHFLLWLLPVIIKDSSCRIFFLDSLLFLPKYHLVVKYWASRLAKLTGSLVLLRSLWSDLWSWIGGCLCGIEFPHTEHFPMVWSEPWTNFRFFCSVLVYSAQRIDLVLDPHPMPNLTFYPEWYPEFQWGFKVDSSLKSPWTP